MAGRLDVDPDLVRRLAELLDETGLSEIEYESGGRRVRVVRHGAPAAPAAAPPAPSPEAPDAPDAAPRADGFAVTSPMVGTAYLSPEPGAPPYVSVGDAVSEGQTVMLIEAMKTYNPVRAPCGGTVLEIRVGDATPVEFGEELVILG